MADQYLTEWNSTTDGQKNQLNREVINKTFEACRKKKEAAAKNQDITRASGSEK